MGVGAQAAIWAEINGMDLTDMDGERWVEFYDEYDREALDPDFDAKRTCPVCNKRLKSALGVRNHTRDVHGAGQQVVQR